MKPRSLAPLLALLAALSSCADGLQEPASAGAGGRGDGFVATGGAGQGGAAACVAQSFPAQPRAVDLYVMLDQSGSMSTYAGAGKTRWGAVTSALESFFELPSAQALGAGLQYFGLPPTLCDPHCSDAPGCCAPSAFCWSCDTGMCCAESLQCEPLAYETPEVPIGTIAENAPALLASIEAHGPADFVGTPTGPALSGALGQARAWVAAHPSHSAAVMLVTDGEPTGCTPSTISSVAEIAQAAALAEPAIPTYVVGVGTVDNLDAIALAGGTGSAYLVDDAEAAANGVMDALQAIQASLPCAYDLPAAPAGEELDLDQINLTFAATEGADPETVVHVDGASECAAEGWYYDDPKSPTKILVCAETCKAFRASSSGQVALEVGCRTVVK